MSAPHAGQFDETDPHGQGHHGHKIVSPFTLRFVLAILLAFTVLTVGAAKLEEWVVLEFGVHLPHWINIVGVLIIATIKGLLVMAYFMQLKYDNPINTVIMAFTFFAFAIFLGFSLIDLAARDRLYKYKEGEIVVGGTGGARRLFESKDAPSFTGPIVQASRKAKIEELGEAKFRELEHEAHAKAHHAKSHEHAGSSDRASRPLVGPTGLFGGAKKDDHHEKGHEPAKPAGGH